MPGWLPLDCMRCMVTKSITSLDFWGAGGGEVIGVGAVSIGQGIRVPQGTFFRVNHIIVKFVEK